MIALSEAWEETKNLRIYAALLSDCHDARFMTFWGWKFSQRRCSIRYYFDLITEIISAPPQNIAILPSISHEDDQYLNVSCSVTGVYPLPVIDLSWTNKWD